MRVGLIEDPSWGRSGGGRSIAQRGFVRAFAADPTSDRRAIFASNPAALRWLNSVLSIDERARIVRRRDAWPARTRLDVVQCIGELDEALQRACVRAGRCPVVFGTHGYPIDTRADVGQAAALLTAGMAPHDAIVCSSRAMQRGWAAVFAMFDAKRHPAPLLAFIPWGVDTDVLQPEHAEASKRRLGLDPQRLTIGFMGRLSVASKADLLPLVRAISQLELPSPPTLVIGGPEIEPGYADAIARFAGSIGTSVPHFIGNVSPAHRRHALGAMDIVVCLSDLLGEGQGLAPLDAMACGRPVVASAWAGYRDSVVHGETGFVIPTFSAPGFETAVETSPHRAAVLAQSVVTDLAALQRALHELASNAPLRARMGAAGRARVEAEYAWPRILTRYRELWANQLTIRRGSEHETKRRENWPLAHQASIEPEALHRARVSVTALGRADDRVVPVHAAIDAHIDTTQLDRLLYALGEQSRRFADLVDLGDGAAVRHALFLAKHGFITVEL